MKEGALLVSQVASTVTSVAAAIGVLSGWAPEFLILQAIPLLVLLAVVSTILVWIPRTKTTGGFGRGRQSELLTLPIKAFLTVLTLGVTGFAIGKLVAYDRGAPRPKTNGPDLEVRSIPQPRLASWAPAPKPTVRVAFLKGYSWFRPVPSDGLLDLRTKRPYHDGVDVNETFTRQEQLQCLELWRNRARQKRNWLALRLLQDGPSTLLDFFDRHADVVNALKPDRRDWPKLQPEEQHLFLRCFNEFGVAANPRLRVYVDNTASSQAWTLVAVQAELIVRKSIGGTASGGGAIPDRIPVAFTLNMSRARVGHITSYSLDENGNSFVVAGGKTGYFDVTAILPIQSPSHINTVVFDLIVTSQDEIRKVRRVRVKNRDNASNRPALPAPRGNA